jgi:hypothetical protein
MPFTGVTSDDYRDISFDFLSPIFVLSILLRFIATIDFLIIMSKIIPSGLKFDHLAVIILCGGGIFIGMYFNFLASRWSEYMTYWCENERIFSAKIYEGKKFFKKFGKNIAIVSILIIGYGLSECHKLLIYQC